MRLMKFSLFFSKATMSFLLKFEKVTLFIQTTSPLSIVGSIDSVGIVNASKANHLMTKPNTTPMTMILINDEFFICINN